MEKSNKVPIVLFAIGFLVSVILGYFIGGAFSFEDVNASNFFDKVEYVFEHPFHNWYNDKTIKIFFIFFVIFLMFYAVFLDSYYKKFMFGKEMGSAKWGNVKRFNKKLQDKTSYKNEKKEQKKTKGETGNCQSSSGTTSTAISSDFTTGTSSPLPSIFAVALEKASIRYDGMNICSRSSSFLSASAPKQKSMPSSTHGLGAVNSCTTCLYVLRSHRQS